MKKIQLLIPVFIIIILQSAFSQTNVSGGIFSNTTWDLAGSPYIVTADVVVMTGVTLTISPGVQVRFQDATGLEVKGDLNAIGTASDTIFFTSNSGMPVQGQWHDIIFWNDLTLKYVKITYARNGLDNHYYKILNVSNSTFSNNTTGINHLGNSAGYGSIDSTRFENNNTAITSASDADYISNSMFLNNYNGIGNIYGTLLSNCIFSGNQNYAINGVGADYIGNIITNNNIGLNLKVYQLNFQFSNNIISNNQIGIKIRGDATSTPNTGFINNTICNNSIYDIQVMDNVSVYLSNNCWCTNDSTIIDSHIFDAHDDLNLGIVMYDPFVHNCGLGTDELIQPDNISVFPNPFSDYTFLCFDNPHSSKVSLSILDIHGKEVRKISDFTSDKIRIDREKLSSGIYFYRLYSDLQPISNGKLIID